MRLVGATPRQVSLVATVESTVSAIAGTAVGFGVFFACHNALAAIAFTGARFFPADLSLGPVDILAVALGVPLAAAVAARVALRRVQVSPLGVSRRVTPRPPRAYRLIPLALGIAELAYFIPPGRRPPTSAGQIQAFLPGFLVIMVGLVIAGPWLTMAGSRLMAKRARRVASLIAARRLADNPQAGFRAVSGLVLALFVTTVAVGVIGTIVDERGGASPDSAAASNLVESFRHGSAPVGDQPVPAGLTSIPDVRAVAVVREGPEDLRPHVMVQGPGAADPGPQPGDLASCAELARNPTFGRCAPGAEVAWVFTHLMPWHASSAADTVWPTAPVTVDELRQLPVTSVVVGTDGSRPAIERARTVLEAAYPQVSPSTEAEWNADSNRLLNQWKQLANVVVVASLVIAGCSLAVSVTGGLSERKRPFSLLRLTGVPLDVLRRVIALESGVTLLAAAVVATGTGLLAAHLFLRAQLHYSLHPLGVAYYGIVLGGLAASVAIIAATLPLLRRITGPETARNE
jgi:FtsX-like permease family